MYMRTKEYLTKILETPVEGAMAGDVATYLGILSADLSQLTLYEYRKELAGLCAMFPERRTEDYTIRDIEQYVAHRSMAPGRKAQRISPYTRKKILASLSGYFSWAVNTGRCPQGNPMFGMRRPKLPTPEPRAWTIEEISRVLSVPLENPRDRILLAVLARTAQRQGAVRRLRWSDIHLDAQPPKIVFPGEIMKNGEPLEMPISRELYRDLKAYESLRKPEPDEWLFPSRKKTGAGHIEDTHVGRIVEKACRLARVPRPWTPHMFRRTTATILFEEGVEFSVISKKILNHKNPQTTLQHYRMVRHDETERALNTLPF